jgi:hypothetical protein
MSLTRPLTRPLAGILVVVAATAALTACHDSTSSSPGPSDEQSAAIGTTAQDEAEASLNALTLPTLLVPIGNDPPCATPSSTTDADGDGIPDDATYEFTSPPCHFTGFRGGTLDVVGQLRMRDPTPSAAGFGYDATLTVLRYTITSGDGKTTYSITRNGNATLTGSTAGLFLSTDLQVARTFTGQPDAAVDEQWTVTYSPKTPLQINQPIPAGTLDISGTLAWTRGTENFSLTVTTPTPLHYAACTDTAQRFDAGELRASGTFDGTAGYVRVRWSECGKSPEVRFVPA